ncbi:MAG: polysaccharide biosynthesis protein [Oscillatoria princeps RMCB-10]|nr:polysaccharide biosynthesis protein [Oscillatoria princeps RMCB-10]
MNLAIKSLEAVLETAAYSLSRRQKRYILMAIDAVLLLLAIYCALLLRFGSLSPSPEIYRYAWLIAILIGIKLICFRAMGLYRSILRYTGLEFLLTAVLKAVGISSGLLIIIAYLLESWPLPRSILAIDALLTLLFVVGVRVCLRWLVYEVTAYSRRGAFAERVVIYGAGATGSQLAQSLATNPAYRLVAFVDDSPSLHQQVVHGLTVYSPADLPKLRVKKPFDTILLAMPSADGKTRLQILQRLQPLSVAVKTVPTIGEILSGKVSISKIRNIDIADLLGREEVAPNLELLRMNVTDKAVLVTGAGGSIGSELCRQIAFQKPKCLVLYELSEFALYSIDMELAETHPTLNRVACLGSVTDSSQLMAVLSNYQVDTVYHAAAYKHVPLVEANPPQGVWNNILGTLTAARCAVECGVSKFVLISTDKAVRPTNVMGATKRVAELILQALAERPKTATCFTMVRFGNVLDSSGSVVPRFRKQIAEGKPITLTHPDMTRYFMSIPEAASLVIQAGAMAKGGDVFLLDMGEPVRIYDLAVQMICLSGLEPGQDVEIQITGLRPGEKIHEELLIDSAKARATKHPKIFCAHESKIRWEFLQPRLEALFAQARRGDGDGIRAELQHLVPEYQPKTGTVREGAARRVSAQ